ncbi:hypothetical protein [uncultured Lamprocystis sp.]|uniref:hypothetical protein n=1 Tax=uncultured Lamprocystis sp. TaxID=543132 RepID=UPI0025E4D4B3|nr:hypothetical protein [uncultured Lamprocystis sp.]
MRRLGVLSERAGRDQHHCPRRAARESVTFPATGQEYAAFADVFAFEETPDQLRAIEGVLADMKVRVSWARPAV